MNSVVVTTAVVPGFVSVLLFLAPAPVQNPRITITFTPERDQFAEAAAEYRKVWASEGDRMIAALETASGLKFREKEFNAVIYERASQSGRGNSPIGLRASYSPDVKKGTLVHELGHRLNAQLQKRPKDLDEHRILFLYLYEVWQNLYGTDFANREVEFEKGLKGLYDYESAWNWALSLSREERAARFQEIRKANKK